MKLPLYLISLALVLVCFVASDAQKRKPASRSASVRSSEAARFAVVIDESLSVLRTRPSLFAEPVQRMRRGRRIQIIGSTEADGVRFYKVSVPPSKFGWVQSDAVFLRSRGADEERLARLILAADGFDQIELAIAFLDIYPASEIRPPVLLLLGDLLEDAASKLSRDATSRLRRREMAASGAPLHSYYLNFNMIDRYRRLGITFLFNSSLRTFHYDGQTWTELVRKYPGTNEAAEAKKRLDSLQEKMQRRMEEN